MVMVTGRLMQYKGSLARAALPLVLHLEWGWHLRYPHEYCIKLLRKAVALYDFIEAVQCRDEVGQT
jgi:hypothetical protein